MARTVGISFVLILAALAAPATPALMEQADDEVRREALLHLTREPFSLDELRRLSGVHDMMAVEKLDRALRRRLELRQRVGRIAPRALDEELVETLLGIEKLAPDLAEERAQEILERLPLPNRPAFVSRLVLARRGDISVIREALTHYFEEPPKWGNILSEAARSTGDPRLQDFSASAKPQGASSGLPLLQTELERTFANSRQKWKLGELLFWGERTRSLVAARLLSHIPEGTLHEDWVRHILADYAAPPRSVADSSTDATRLRALAALGWRQSKNQTGVLLRALAGSEPLAAAVSASALGRIASVEARTALREKALSEEPDVAAAAVAALIELGGREEARGLFEKRPHWDLLAAIPFLEVLDGRVTADAAVIEKLVGRIVDSEDRLPLLRLLAERDDPALSALDMGADEVEQLYPYLSRSEYEPLRALVFEVGEESRGPALAALLLSPTASRAEKMEAAKVLGDTWPEAVCRGGPRVVDALGRLEFWERRGKQVFTPERVTKAWIAAVSKLPGEGARKALERVGTVEAIQMLARRGDHLHALPALSRLKREGDGDVREAAELTLLSLNAPGSSMLMQQRLKRPETLRSLIPYSNGTPQATAVLAAVAVGDDPRPDVQASLFAYYQDRPQDYLALLGIEEPSAHRRVHATLALSDNPARLPLLLDVAAFEERVGSRRAALRGLADAELGRDAFRLHRSAGDPDREVRFAVAAALVPSGDVWAMRLMMAEMNPRRPGERLAALKAIKKLPPAKAESLLEELFWDGTGSAFGNHVLFEMVGGISKEQEPRAWELVANQLDEDPFSLLIAARLERADAVQAVIERIE